MAQWIGYMVSIKCCEDLGTFQGEIVSATNSIITLTKAFCNGFPCDRSEVHIKASDIMDLKLIEKLSEGSEEHSTITIAKPIAKRVGRTQSTSDSNNVNNKFNNSTRSKPIDIEVKHNTNEASSSYKNTPNKREKNKGKWTKGWKDEECFGSPLDQNISKDFDFEKNLALFNKQALWEELNAQKPDVVKHADNKKSAKYRHDENVIASAPAVYRQITVPKQDFCEYVTDDGLIIPSISRSLRKKLYESAERLGLTWERRIELMGRATAEISMQLLGGGHRLNPRNTHQWPTVVVLCGPHNSLKLKEGNLKHYGCFWPKMEYGASVGNRAGLETVRTLHQTVIALRAALEESKNQILELKNKSLPVKSIEEALRSLTVENHVLRRKLLDANVKNPEELTKVNNNFDESKIPIKSDNKSSEIVVSEQSVTEDFKPQNNDDIEENEAIKKKKVTFPNLDQSYKHRNLEAKILIKAETTSPRNVSKSLESLTIIKSPLEKIKTISFSKTLSFSNLSKQVNREFSFEGTKMTDKNQNCKQPPQNDKDEQDAPSSPQNDLDQAEVDDIELIFTTDDTKDSDFKEQLVPIDSTHDVSSNLMQLPLSDGDQNLDASDREIDDDVFNDNIEEDHEKRDMCDSKSDMSLNQEKSLKSYYSLQDSSFENKSFDKDESFDRFEERIQVIETDISKCGIHDIEYNATRRYTCPNPLSYKPLLHRETVSKGLAFSRRSRPILTQSNARRRESGAQTDISALPGAAWRSESSLAPKTQISENFTTLPSKIPLPGSRLKLSEKTVEARRVLLSDIGFTSMVPELSRSADHLFQTELKPPPPVYGQFLRATDLYSPGYPSIQKFQWNATPSTTSQSQSHYSSMYHLSSPPTTSRRYSAPGSPNRKNLRKSLPSKVRFANGSLPELRDWTTTVDSGDSTDSLVEEAENYLRRSIDCIVTATDKKPVPRRASAPEPSGDNVPPNGWQPFLPRVPRDLKLDHWVKVITPEGRVRGGRIRYIGTVVSQIEQFVGVQLSTPEGYSDGTYNSRRYFQCEPYHGIFVPFKKVIMGWRP